MIAAHYTAARTFHKRSVATAPSRRCLHWESPRVHAARSIGILAALSTTAAIAQVRSGAELYGSACAACHGPDGRGKTQSEVGFAIPLPDFTDCDFAVREPDSDWSAIVHGGGRARGFDPLMPAFEEALSSDEIEQILSHVRAFCRDERWPRGELNMPRALFTEKAFPEDEAVITTTIVTEGLDSLTTSSFGNNVSDR